MGAKRREVRSQMGPYKVKVKLRFFGLTNWTALQLVHNRVPQQIDLPGAFLGETLI
jgi:hypothetical protein